MTRPPQKVFRKASFKARIFARLAFYLPFLYQSYALLPPSRYRRTTRSPEHETEAPLPVYRSDLSRADRPRLGATSRDRRDRRDKARRRDIGLSRVFHAETASLMPQ